MDAKPETLEATRAWFEEKFIPEPMSGCFLWLCGLIGVRNRDNPHLRAGVRWEGASGVSASRAAYALYKGEITNSLHVLHKCDNPLCVNPDHLYLGTQRDNANDIARRSPRKSLRCLGDFCFNGHPMNDQTVRVAAYGRVCRVCQREASDRYKARRRAGA